jgi:hypothetical protein
LKEAVILCEGFWDRAFWKGWLEHLGWKDARIHTSAKLGIAFDPSGLEVKGAGQFAYYSVNDRFLRVVPCYGKDNVLRYARLRIQDREQLSHLIINVDSDANADGTPHPATALSRHSVIEMIRRIDPKVIETESQLLLDNGATSISLVHWMAGDPVMDGLPNQETLERLVSASICAAYPERGSCVQQWLLSRGVLAPLTVKEYAWSYMAGWYAEKNCDSFYEGLWRDNRIADELKSRLQRSGAWTIIQAISL